jgi:hypothetical protein
MKLNGSFAFCFAAMAAAANMAATVVRSAPITHAIPLLASYQIGEPGGNDDNLSDSGSPASQGPVRLARFSYVEGNVTWRPTDQDDWSKATVNLPIRQGAQIWAADAGRAEIQFDDGSLIRLGHGAVVTLQTLYSDSSSEFTEVQLNQGLIAMRLHHGDSQFQVDTSYASVKASGPAKIRVGVADGVEVAVQGGSASILGAADNVTMHPGDYLFLDNPNSSFNIESTPDADSWDRWNSDRDRGLSDADTDQYVPENIAQVCGPLDSYGSWRHDPSYGEVWCPRYVDSSWRPYSDGSWVWVAPFGWTWVSNEPWGWAPYHYGSWYHAPYGWCWVPGPSHQYWCPAVVHYSECDGNVAWCPLAPEEVRYPSQLSFGFANGGSWLHFSIGGCAVYYPGDDNHCDPHPWNNRYVNRHSWADDDDHEFSRVANHDLYDDDHHFVPRNAHHDGVTTVSLGGFGGHGDFHREGHDASNLFLAGRGIGAPDRDNRPYSGPIAVRPDSSSLTPDREFFKDRHPTGNDLNRPVFRAPLPGQVSSYAPPFHNFGKTPMQVSNEYPGQGDNKPQGNGPQWHPWNNGGNNGRNGNANLGNNGREGNANLGNNGNNQVHTDNQNKNQWTNTGNQVHNDNSNHGNSGNNKSWWNNGNDPSNNIGQNKNDNHGSPNSPDRQNNTSNPPSNNSPVRDTTADHHQWWNNGNQPNNNGGNAQTNNHQNNDVVNGQTDNHQNNAGWNNQPDRHQDNRWNNQQGNQGNNGDTNGKHEPTTVQVAPVQVAPVQQQDRPKTQEPVRNFTFDRNTQNQTTINDKRDDHHDRTDRDNRDNKDNKDKKDDKTDTAH